MTLIIGWWALPLAVTVAAWAYVILNPPKATGGHYGNIGAAMESLLQFGVASIVTLVAWLVYFAARVAFGA